MCPAKTGYDPLISDDDNDDEFDDDDETTKCGDDAELEAEMKSLGRYTKAEPLPRLRKPNRLAQVWKDYKLGRQLRKGDKMWRPNGDGDGYFWRSETGFIDEGKTPNWRAKWVIEVKDTRYVPTCQIWGPKGRKEPNFDVWHWISRLPHGIHLAHSQELRRRRIVGNPYW
ncbi:hypothetical protein AK830_g9200 [Neonectria ditissima]|uniref:Uncharacterized protein n=1 Tax=Neonectria ditissima TaxID=78410 RepID=A0A0P7B9J5_9HYPO|nr:hypothetical protein AK830_g9200 [Neonectria ditissima]